MLAQRVSEQGQLKAGSESGVVSKSVNLLPYKPVKPKKMSGLELLKFGTSSETVQCRLYKPAAVSLHTGCPNNILY